jgi:hypothetical protein
MTADTAADDANLHWAITTAERCQEVFGSQLCAACRAQARSRCALAAYAERLVVERYAASPMLPPLAKSPDRMADGER